MNSYIYSLNSTFYNVDLYDTLDKNLSEEEKRIIRYRHFPFKYLENHRYQGSKESKKFVTYYDNHVRSLIYFNKILETIRLTRSTVNSYLTIDDDLLADIVSAKLQVDFLTYKTLTSFDSNWFW